MHAAHPKESSPGPAPSFPEMPRPGEWRERPLRVPAMRGLRWLVEVWRAETARLMFSGQMGVATGVALTCLISDWDKADGFVSMAMLAGFTIGMLQLYTGAPKRGVCAAAASLAAATLWVLPFFCLPLAATLWGLEAMVARPHESDSAYAALFFSLPMTVVLCSGCFVAALWAVLVTTLTKRFWPDFPKALHRASLAVRRNLSAFVLCALALGSALTVLMAAAMELLGASPFTEADMKSRLALLCLLPPLSLFMLEALLVPRLMARDMFYEAGAEQERSAISGKNKNCECQ